MKKRFYYLMEIQYLGFRYHGWQKQPNVITVQKVILKTLNWVHPNGTNKVLASGRTDAKVSVNQTYIEIFTDIEIEDLTFFLADFNQNLPADVKALSVEATDKMFNIIQSPKIKEYHYYFSSGEKFHPYSAAFMANFIEKLNISRMKEAARMFEGKRDFYSYTFRPRPDTQTTAEVLSCILEENTEFKASFFPKKSYVIKIRGMGFKRNQIRLMVGMLIELGSEEKSWDEFIQTLDGSHQIKLSYIAPASGLQLYKVTFKEQNE